MRRFLLAASAAFMAGVLSTPAQAATQITTGDICRQTTVSYQSCVAYEGNLLNNSSITDINQILDALVGGNYSPDALWSDLDPTKLLIMGSGNDPNGVITFAQALLGPTILGVHFGNAGTSGVNGSYTQFYLFDFQSPTTSLTLNTQGFSDGIIVSGIPEPATWAMMLLGFAAIGSAMRRRRSRLQTQIA